MTKELHVHKYIYEKYLMPQVLMLILFRGMNFCLEKPKRPLMKRETSATKELLNSLQPA